MINYKSSYFSQLLLIAAVCCAMFNCAKVNAQSTDNLWIRPVNAKSPATWGIRNGIVVGLWPSAIEGNNAESTGGPRGLLRLGYEHKGMVYHINYIAIEPVVNNNWEFSEISPSQIDNRWGKLMWASDSEDGGDYFPAAKTRGKITHPDAQHSEVEELSIYVFIEQFKNGAHPYFRLSIRSDRPEELCIETFNHKNSAQMERCAISATMGNYSRLRMLYLNDKVIDSRKLYKGFDGIDFIEKENYPATQMLKDTNGDLIAIAAPSESSAELAAWPQEQAYQQRWNWRYRPFFKLTQYWRKEAAKYDHSLHVRVNGRAKYWSGGTNNKSSYIDIPGGPSFENFELREKYYPGQKFYFGITKKAPGEILPGLTKLKP